MLTPSDFIKIKLNRTAKPTVSCCTTCGHVGETAAADRGNAKMELGLWLAFAVLAAGYALDRALIHLVLGLPLLGWHRIFGWGLRVLSRLGEVFLLVSVAYTLGRLFTEQAVCAKCHKPTLIPPDSPRAQDLLNKH